MFEGSEHYDRGYFHPLQEAGALAERIDQRRSHELLGGRAVERARAGAVDGIGSHGLPAAGADRREVREPARRRAERAAAELREPALRAGAGWRSSRRSIRRSPVSLADDRRGRRHLARAQLDDVRRVLPTYYHPAQRVAGRSPATSSPTRRCARRATTSASSPGASAAAGRRPAAGRASARRGWCSRIASSCRALPGVAFAGAVRAGRRRARSGRRGAGERQDVAAVSRAGVRAADRDRGRRVAELARDRQLLPDRRDAPPGRTLAELERAITAEIAAFIAERARPRSRWSAAGRRPRRSSSTGCRRSAVSAARSDQLNAYNVFLGEPGLLRSRSRALSRAPAPRRCSRRPILPAPRRGVILSVVPRRGAPRWRSPMPRRRWWPDGGRSLAAADAGPAPASPFPRCAGPRSATACASGRSSTTRCRSSPASC